MYQQFYLYEAQLIFKILYTVYRIYLYVYHTLVLYAKKYKTGIYGELALLCKLSNKIPFWGTN